MTGCQRSKRTNKTSQHRTQVLDLGLGLGTQFGNNFTPHTLHWAQTINTSTSQPKAYKITGTHLHQPLLQTKADADELLH